MTGKIRNSVLSSGFTSIILYWIDDDFYRALASGFAYVIPCIIGSRLSTNLAEVGEVGLVTSKDNGMNHATMSDMRFTSNPAAVHRGLTTIAVD